MQNAMETTIYGAWEQSFLRESCLGAKILKDEGNRQVTDDISSRGNNKCRSESSILEKGDFRCRSGRMRNKGGNAKVFSWFNGSDENRAEGNTDKLLTSTGERGNIYYQCSQEMLIELIIIIDIFLFCDTGVWTQGQHLEPLHQPLFLKGFFELGSRKLFAWDGFKPRSSWSLPPE
jgi:hypothetical protein